MLQLAKDYIPFDIRHPKTQVKKVSETPPKDMKRKLRDAAHVLNLAPTTFYAKTKRNRAIKLLGKGDMIKGYHIYESILIKIQDSFHLMCEALRETPRGFETFDGFRDVMKNTTYTLEKDIHKSGIKQYNKLLRVHHTLKDFQALQDIKKHTLKYIPLERRVPLTKNFLTKYYWEEKHTTGQIADMLVVPEIWVQKEVRRLGMQKKPNGIKLRGKKGFKMPEEQKVKHRNQPHAIPVVQICPREFTVLRRWNATGAVERDGWNRENVRKAIKSAGLHDGFLWAHEGMEDEIIARAKAKGNLEKKLKIWENGHIQKEVLYDLYVVKGLNKEQIAAKLGCTPGAVACRASKFGFSKRVNISTETLKTLYIDQGMKAKEIAQMYGYSTQSIATYLSKRGIKRKTT